MVGVGWLNDRDLGETPLVVSVQISKSVDASDGRPGARGSRKLHVIYSCGFFRVITNADRRRHRQHHREPEYLTHRGMDCWSILRRQSAEGQSY